jgi:glyoxylate/hydroxypyruvate reductase
MTDRPVTVLIASPLEPEHAERIAAAYPGRVRVVHEPDLLPVPRYVGDHNGIPRQLGEADLARWRSLLAEADVLFDFDWLDAPALPRSAPRLRWVQGTSAGIGEYLVRTGLAASDITFTTAAGAHGTALAEFVALGLLSLVKEVAELRRRQARHHWERYTARSLAGRRVLLVGLGNVGRAIARTLGALGVEVIAMARTQPATLPEGVARAIGRDAFHAELAAADALVLACPATPETFHLVGAAELAALPAGAFLVNVARGNVVDEPALVEALRSGHLGGAFLDVFETEPLPPDSPFWDMEHVLVSPHSASTVGGENDFIVDLFLDNLGRFLDGRTLRNVFQRERGY